MLKPRHLFNFGGGTHVAFVGAFVKRHSDYDAIRFAMGLGFEGPEELELAWVEIDR